MDSYFKVEEPKEVKFTLTITLPLKEWIEISEGMGRNNYFSGAEKLRREIQSMVYQAQTIFWPKEEEKQSIPCVDA